MIEKTRASRPSYFPAIRAVQKFKEARIATLTPVELEAINEISRRLTRLDNQVDELININNSFIEQRAPQVQFDAETDTITFRFRDIEQKIKLKRANPNKPIQSDTRSVAGVYKAGQTTEENQEQNPNELVFESALEDHYQNAHKVLKLVRSLP